jgi:hypothetical protein
MLTKLIANITESESVKLYRVLASGIPKMPTDDEMLYATIQGAQVAKREVEKYGDPVKIETIHIKNPYYIGEHPDYGDIYSIGNKAKMKDFE